MIVPLDIKERCKDNTVKCTFAPKGYTKKYLIAILRMKSRFFCRKIEPQQHYLKLLTCLFGKVLVLSLSLEIPLMSVISIALPLFILYVYIDQVDLYSLMCEMLDIDPAPNNGSKARYSSMLVSSAPPTQPWPTPGDCSGAATRLVSASVSLFLILLFASIFLR